MLRRPCRSDSLVTSPDTTLTHSDCVAICAIFFQFLCMIIRKRAVEAAEPLCLMSGEYGSSAFLGSLFLLRLRFVLC